MTSTQTVPVPPALAQSRIEGEDQIRRATAEFIAEIEQTLVQRALRTFDVGVDLDGVVYDFVNAIRTYIAEVTGRPLASMPAPVRWDFYLDWGLTLKQFLEFFHAGVNAGHIFRVGTPMDGVVEGLRLLLRDGHRVHFVTDRARMGDPGLAKKHTEYFLAANEVPFTTLTVDHDKTKVRTDKFIDDRPENYQHLCAAGVDAFLRAHAYNDHVVTPAGRRVTSFLEFVLAVVRDARTLS